MTHSEARKHAFMLIFQFPFHKPFSEETYREMRCLYLDSLSDEENPMGWHVGYFEAVTAGVYARAEELDRVIEHHLREWRIERINMTDLAILRLAIYELLYEPGIPAGATLNEAV